MFGAPEFGLCFGADLAAKRGTQTVSPYITELAPPRTYCGQGKTEEKSRLFGSDVKLFAPPLNCRFLIVFLTLHRA